jgi:hypothetical protein
MYANTLSRFYLTLSAGIFGQFFRTNNKGFKIKKSKDSAKDPPETKLTKIDLLVNEKV